jgi:hypothetical protein
MYRRVVIVLAVLVLALALGLVGCMSPGPKLGGPDAVTQDTGVTVKATTGTVTVEVKDSTGAPIQGASVSFYKPGPGGRPFPRTDSNGQSTGTLPETGNWDVTVSVFNTSQSKTVYIGTDPVTISFQTSKITVKLETCAGTPLAGGKVRSRGNVSAGTWFEWGTTGSDGTISKEIFPGNWWFSVEYRQTYTEKQQDVGTKPAVTFTTTRAWSSYQGTIRYYGNPSSGTLFTFNKSGTEMLPGNVRFLFDGKGPYTITISGCEMEIAPPHTDDMTITAPADITVEGNTKGGAINVALGDATASGGTPPYTITNDAPGFFPLGTTIVTWTATDAGRNSATATQRVTIVDTTPPKITAVESFNVIVGAPSSALPLPTVSDIVDPSPTVTNNAPASFHPGTTVVTWTAMDTSGNSATATTTVIAVYGFSGLLPPYQAPPTTFKLGRTIPLKWQYTDYTGTVIDSSSAAPYVEVRFVSSSVGEGDSISIEDPGTSGRQYDPLTYTWQFNWQTKGLSTGTYAIYIVCGQTGQRNGPFLIQLRP